MAFAGMLQEVPPELRPGLRGVQASRVFAMLDAIGARVSEDTLRSLDTFVEERRREQVKLQERRRQSLG